MARKAESDLWTVQGRTTKALVPIPSEPGRWFVVAACVVVVSCPDCGASKGSPCVTDKTGRKLRARYAGQLVEPGSPCPACVRSVPGHRAGHCPGRAAAFEKLGGQARAVRGDATRCAACRSVWYLDPGTAICPSCHAPRTAAGHYARGAG